MRLVAVLGLLAAGVVTIAWLRVASVDVAGLARRNPGRTAVMDERAREARRLGRVARVRQSWVPLGRVAPSLRAAVLVAEDDAFFAHGGLDWGEIRESAKRNLAARRVVRGGSTITQQLAKNLWLGTSRSPWRKLEEVLLAFRLERSLGKRRILELYLNVIEWGDGVYGAEAAAREWYGASAASLTVPESVRLAAVIINPRRYSPIERSPRIERRIRLIASRLRRRGAISEDDYRDTVGLPSLRRGPFDFLMPWRRASADSTDVPVAPDSSVEFDTESAPDSLSPR